ncbi:hypothetical protein ANCDUO_17027 [Ancylostoma duodenale]|uniref:Profilin n=1 Tax=Ancylostoma duodenale TaxID=51022 RepID=A0A0C2CSU8_9BILA|nr:hypothetical protein ANCDUO_17027 [Ancylostoma duodenale]
MTDSSPAIKRAAIIGTDGSVWARTQNANAFRVHYIVPRTEENLIFGKKDKSGFFAAKTKTAILIAMYEGENQVSAEVRTAVEKMAKYLEDSGY